MSLWIVDVVELDGVHYEHLSPEGALALFLPTKSGSEIDELLVDFYAEQEKWEAEADE